MESYIVRIYRRHQSHAQKVAGQVEVIETGEKRAFKSTDELWEIINPAKKPASKKARIEGDGWVSES